MRIGLVQCTSSNNLENNLTRLRALTSQAVQAGAQLVVCPEMAYFMGKQNEWSPLIDRYPEILGRFQTLAKELGVFLLPGSLREPSSQPGRFFNTLPAIDEKGRLVAQYRKIFLFRANLPDRVYSEGLFADGGDRTVVCNGPAGVKLGLGICYDLRFPELFRSLRAGGAQLVVLPASFTVPTGRAHWEILLRARAIENQVFVLAPGQTGTVGDGAETYGHSLVVAPWGEKLAEKTDGEGTTIVDLDLSQIDAAAARVDSWRSRRAELFPVAVPALL